MQWQPFSITYACVKHPASSSLYLDANCDVCGEPLRADAGPLPAEIGGRRVLGVIGQGYNAVVFRAGANGDTSALRAMADRAYEARMMPGVELDFEREVRLHQEAAALPEVPDVLAHGVEVVRYRGQPIRFLWVDMEYRRGRSLEALFRAPARLPPGAELGAVRGMVSLLCGLASMGLDHNDLNAANLLVDGDRLSVVDFGLLHRGRIDIPWELSDAQYVAQHTAHLAALHTARVHEGSLAACTAAEPLRELLRCATAAEENDQLRNEDAAAWQRALRCVSRQRRRRPPTRAAGPGRPG